MKRFFGALGMMALAAYCFAAGLVCTVLDAAELRREKPAIRRPRGMASWYGEGYRGKAMANGQPFDPDAMTCASWDWDLGTMLRVTHPASGRFVIVEVTDRGPAKWTGCLIDLSGRAFRRLEDPSVGKIAVEIVRVPNGEDTP